MPWEVLYGTAGKVGMVGRVKEQGSFRVGQKKKSSPRITSSSKKITRTVPKFFPPAAVSYLSTPASLPDPFMLYARAYMRSRIHALKTHSLTHVGRKGPTHDASQDILSQAGQLRCSGLTNIGRPGKAAAATPSPPYLAYTHQHTPPL